MKNPIVCLLLFLAMLMASIKAEGYAASIMDDSKTLWIIYPTNFWPSNELCPAAVKFVRDVQNNGGGGGGSNVTIAVTNTITGAPGSQAAVTNLGTPQQVNLQFTVPAGASGTNGANGSNGTNGLNGTNGSNGTNGVNGINGTNGLNGSNFTFSGTTNQPGLLEYFDGANWWQTENGNSLTDIPPSAIQSAPWATNTPAGIYAAGGTTNTSSGVVAAAEFPALTGDITTTAGSVSTTLKNTGTAGTYTKTTFDAQGRETSGTTLAFSDMPSTYNALTNIITNGIAATPGMVVTLKSDGTLTLSNAPSSSTGHSHIDSFHLEMEITFYQWHAGAKYLCPE